MREKKNVNSILNELYNHLNAINELCFDYKWSEVVEWTKEISEKYTVEKYGKAKDLNEFIDDINHAIINLEKYRVNEERSS